MISIIPYDNKKYSLRLASPEVGLITFTGSPFCVRIFCLFDEYTPATIDLVLGYSIIINNITYTINSIEDISDVAEKIRIPIYNEYMNQTLENI